MAKKKSRVPTPPRPVQAPKKRVDPRDRRRTRLLMLVVAALVVVAAAAVGIAMAVGGGGSEGAPGACVRHTFAPLPATPHIEALPGGKVPKDFEYNSFPPTSGYHSAQTAIWNVYDRPVPEQNLVHNLEHGGVVVQYGNQVPPETVAEIVAWYDQSREGMIVAALPALGEKIALTAWTHLATCSDFDEGAFSAFRDDYRGPDGDAPEKFPLERLQPGSQ